jgi:tetratricopeptide (TPR) repeat protein
MFCVCRVALIAAAVVLLTFFAQPVAAQAPQAGDQQQLRKEFDDLFQRTLVDPTNLDVVFRYAEVATQLGDYEAAITALERTLFFNPDLPRVQLELGVLYFRLGSYQAAQGYLERARQSPDVPPDVKDKIDLYLGQIARLESRHQFSGSIFTGAQYQSNANVSPASPAIRVLGIDATLADQFTKKDDEAFFLSGSAVYSYDLQNQYRDTIEVTGTGFLSEFLSQKRFDLDFMEGTAGPRFRMDGRGIPGLSVRPYVLGNFVVLDHSLYFSTYGFGISWTKDITKDLSATILYEHRIKNYYNSDDFPTVRELTGHDDVLQLNTAYAITNNQAIGFAFGFTAEHTRIAGESNLQYGGSLTYQIAYAAPIGNPGYQWVTGAAAGRFYTDYSAPDPLFDPDITRADRRWRFNLSEAFPITADITVLLQFQRDVVSSTLPNFAYTNNQFVLGPQWRF